MITHQAAERIAAAIHSLRPDWPASSLVTLIKRDLHTWAVVDVTVGLAYIAVDQKADGTWASKTPARVKEAGPWRSIGLASPSTPGPPKKHESCELHGGWKDSCGGCRADALVGGTAHA